MSFFALSTGIVVAAIFSLAVLLFYTATTLILMLISFVFTRKLKVDVWLSQAGKWVAIIIAQIFICMAVYYNYQNQSLPTTVEDFTLAVCSYSFGIVIACNLYLNSFGKKSNNRIK